MRALVVDDSMLARKMMLNALNQAGIQETDQAQDGCEAVNMVSKNAYDIICMDWNMPNMLGIDAVRKIRSMSKEIPIVMVTGLGDEIHIREAIKAGINNYIVKPFKVEKAVNIIQDTLATATHATS